jgi:hypothetical protein
MKTQWQCRSQVSPSGNSEQASTKETYLNHVIAEKLLEFNFSCCDCASCCGFSCSIAPVVRLRQLLRFRWLRRARLWNRVQDRADGSWRRSRNGSSTRSPKTAARTATQSNGEEQPRQQRESDITLEAKNSHLRSTQDDQSFEPLFTIVNLSILFRRIHSNSTHSEC